MESPGLLSNYFPIQYYLFQPPWLNWWPVKTLVVSTTMWLIFGWWLNQPAFQLDNQMSSWFLVVSTSSWNADSIIFRLIPGWWLNQPVFHSFWSNQPWLFQQPKHFRRSEAFLLFYIDLPCNLIFVTSAGSNFYPCKDEW